MRNDLATNKSVVRHYIEQVINTGDTSRISQYISSEYREEYNGQYYQLGIEGAVKHVEGVRKVYPDLQLTILNQIGEGQWVCTYYSMSGTHSSEWMGIQPTGQKVMIYGVNMNRVIDGKIVEHGGAANLLEPLLKIKAIKIV